MRGLRSRLAACTWTPSIRLSPKRIGAAWPKVLEDVVRRVEGVGL